MKDEFTKDDIYDIFYNLLNEMVNGILVVEDDGDQYPIVFANHMLNQMMGREVRTIKTGHPESAFDLIYISDQIKARNSVDACTVAKTSKESYRLCTMGEKNMWVLATHKRVQDAGGKYLFFNFANIHELMDAQRKLRDDSNKWSDIVNNVPTGLVIFHMDLEEEECQVIAVNNRLVAFSNEVGKRVDGNTRDWTPQELSVILSQNIYAFSTNEDIPLVRRMLSESILSDTSSCTFRLRGSDVSHPVWIRSYCHSKIVAGERIFYVTFSDSTEEMESIERIKQSHEQLRILSYQDSLTGLFNRNALNELCDYVAANPLRKVGMAFADLNGLKRVNDTFGHRHGDNMIKKFANILRSEFDDECCFRISGDEFVVVAKNMERGRFNDKMHAIISKTQDADEIASIGFIWEDRVTDVRHTSEEAEQLMYVEKQRYYATEEAREANRHKSYMNKLMKELEQGLYVCYLQPKADIDSHVITGAEALIRKIGKNGEIIAPYLFIPMLEHQKLIPQIDFFMLEEVCKILRRWEDEGRRPVKISVNMSRVTLSEYDYIEHLTAVIDKYHVNRALLELEITESNATMDHNLLIDEVEQIKELGIGVSIDDMGTEYSSLRMMILNGVDTVKLDRSFILQMKEASGLILVKQMISLCKELGLHSIAEGVESDEQRMELQELGCDSYQGYLLSQPIPVAEFEKLVERSYASAESK